jgi:hypothetical protein
MMQGNRVADETTNDEGGGPELCFSYVNRIQACSLDLEVELWLIVSSRILGFIRHITGPLSKEHV